MRRSSGLTRAVRRINADKRRYVSYFSATTLVTRVTRLKPDDSISGPSS